MKEAYEWALFSLSFALSVTSWWEGPATEYVEMTEQIISTWKDGLVELS